MNHIMTYHVDWNQHAAGLQEPERTMVVEYILKMNMDAGAKCVRVGPWDHDWLLPIFERLNVPKMCLFNGCGAAEGHEAWLAMVGKIVARSDPEYVIIDREKTEGKQPDLVKDVLDIVLKYGNAEIQTFCGEYHFPEYSGDVPCPEFYKIWDNSRWPGHLTPVQRIRLFQAHYPWRRIVKGGYPWLCPLVDAWRPEISPFVPLALGYWKDACCCLRDQGAAGITQYQTAGGNNYGRLSDDRHKRSAEYTHAANEVFDA